jgi:hypothetical protein
MADAGAAKESGSATLAAKTSASARFIGKIVAIGS